MKKAKEILNPYLWDDPEGGQNVCSLDAITAMKEYGKQMYNQAVKDCSESATAYVTQESVNGGKVAKVNQESILKNLKK